MADRFIISNTFSLRMLEYCFHELIFEPIPQDCVRDILKNVLKDEPEKFVSIVGHESTAKLLSELLGVEIKPNRIVVDMGVGDEALATQFLIRIQEGKVLNEKELKELYDNGKIVFRLIKRIA